MKECKKCRENKNETEFYTHGKLKNKIYYWCKECCRINSRKRYITHNRNLSLIYFYGLTQDEFNRLSSVQEHKCAICFKIKKLCVDHDHKTGKVRQLLCYYCNRTLYHFETKLEYDKFMNYLKKHGINNESCNN